jgi:hypothetical protein
MHSAKEIIEALKLTPLREEGGFFYETYRSGEIIRGPHLPPRYGSNRCLGTAIYYLLSSGTYSCLHRLKSDEVFHFYLGDPVEMLLLSPGGQGITLTMGQDITRGQVLQTVVPAGTWQGASLKDGGSFALLGTTVAPGFEFADFETANPLELEEQFPLFRERIRQLRPIAAGLPGHSH